MARLPTNKELKSQSQEDYCILRLPPHYARELHERLDADAAVSLGTDFEIDLSAPNPRFKIRGKLMKSKLVEFPTIIELQKTNDAKHLYKLGDVHQMLVVDDPDQPGDEEEFDADDEESALLMNGLFSSSWPNGLTRPMRHARKRRFRKTVRPIPRYSTVIEDEVTKLLQADFEADSVHLEKVYYDPNAKDEDDVGRMQDVEQSSQPMAGARDDDESSGTDDDDDDAQTASGPAGGQAPTRKLTLPTLGSTTTSKTPSVASQSQPVRSLRLKFGGEESILNSATQNESHTPNLHSDFDLNFEEDMSLHSDGASQLAGSLVDDSFSLHSLGTVRSGPGASSEVPIMPTHDDDHLSPRGPTSTTSMQQPPIMPTAASPDTTASAPPALATAPKDMPAPAASKAPGASADEEKRQRELLEQREREMLEQARQEKEAREAEEKRQQESQAKKDELTNNLETLRKEAAGIESQIASAPNPILKKRFQASLTKKQDEIVAAQAKLDALSS